MDGPHSDTHKNNGAGSQLYLRSWALANSSVVDYITLLVSMSEYRQSFLDLQLRDRLSVADAIVLHQHLGLSKAANYIDVVDPWCYPDDDTPAVISVKGCLQSVVDKVTSEKLSEKNGGEHRRVSPVPTSHEKRPSTFTCPKTKG